MIPTILALILAAFVILAVAANSDHAPNHGLALVVEDPSPDESDVEVVDELPLRAQAIGFRPHTQCVNHWADGEPHRVHAKCRAAIALAQKERP